MARTNLHIFFGQNFNNGLTLVTNSTHPDVNIEALVDAASKIKSQPTVQLVLLLGATYPSDFEAHEEGASVFSIDTPYAAPDKRLYLNEVVQTVDESIITLQRTRRINATVNETSEYEVDKDDWVMALEEYDEPADALIDLINSGQANRISYDSDIDDVHEEFDSEVTEL
jgi:hypothetical protein